MRSSAAFPGLLRPVPLSEPPRRVSLLLRLQVLVGGVLNQLGWAVTGVGLFSFVAALDDGVFPAVLTLGFVLVGGVMLSAGTRDSIRAMRLLSSGVPATGRIVGSSATPITVGEQPVMELHFEFEARDGKRYRAHAVAVDESRLRDEAEEPLLYDPLDPARAVVLDGLPGHPRIDDDGALRARSFGRALLPLIIPLFFLVVTALGIYHYPLE